MNVVSATIEIQGRSIFQGADSLSPIVFRNFIAILLKMQNIYSVFYLVTILISKMSTCMMCPANVCTGKIPYPTISVIE